jgi:hypothetical protein
VDVTRRAVRSDVGGDCREYFGRGGPAARLGPGSRLGILAPAIAVVHQVTPVDVGTGGTGQEQGVPAFRVHHASERPGLCVV